MTHEHLAAVDTALRYLRRVVARGPQEEAELLAAVQTLATLAATPVTSR